MARLQDYPSITPTSSDKLLVVQSQSQGLVPYGSKLDSANPTGTGSLSLNRKANTTTGTNSVATGYNTTASGDQGFAEGHSTTASGNQSHAEGYNTTASATRAHAEGSSTTASGNYSHSEGADTTASGSSSHAEGLGTIANHISQHTFGSYNEADGSTAASTARGNYIEIVGNGTSTSNRSNARTLDWSGNEVLAGDLSVKGNVSVYDAIKTESGTITFATGITDNGSVLKKCNGIVYLHLDCYSTTAISSRTHILTLPSGFRPTNFLYSRFIIGGSRAHNSYFNVMTTAYITNTGALYLGDVIQPQGASMIDITADISFMM